MGFSVTVQLDTVGVWIIEARSEQEPGLHLAPHPLTVTQKVTYARINRQTLRKTVKAVYLRVNLSHQCYQSILKPSANTTGTVFRPPVQRDFL